MAASSHRDHGGGIDAAAKLWGGNRNAWLDLSTGINPEPYALPEFSADAWTALPDRAAQDALEQAARAFWNVPEDAAILAAPGASALIARIPSVLPAGKVHIPEPTYNEHGAAFDAQGWTRAEENTQARVLVHPNNPTGHLWSESDLDDRLTVIDESFCDVTPEASLVHLAGAPNRIILKSFGKFWGLAGLRLGFAFAHPDAIAKLADLTGPWAVSGPALDVGARALQDTIWAQDTRARLAEDSKRLDTLMLSAGARIVGGTSLFRLYDVDDAKAWQDRFAAHRIWTRIFPYSKTFLRLGLPPASEWHRIEAAL